MTKKNQQSGLTTEELQQLLVATIDLPFIREKRTKTDYMLDVLETVLNFHLQEPVVLSALAYFQKHHNPPPVHQWQPQCIHTHADLQNALNGFADTPEGNKEASQYLWGNRHLRISAIVDACFRLIVDGVSAPSWTRRGCAQARG